MLAKPAFELFRCVRGSIIQDEDHCVDAPSQRFGNDFLLNKGLEIDKTLAAAAGSVDLAIRDGKPGKQMPCATTMVARFMEHRLASLCWARRLLPLSCLNGGFLIEADQPGPFS